MRQRSDQQPELPFDFDALDEPTLRAAHARSRLKMPFEVAVRNKALAICLRCAAQSRLRERADHG